MESSLTITTTLAAALLISVGCASTRTNLVDTGKVDLVVADTGPIKVTRAKVLQDESGVVITGKVARESRRAYWLRGHVDLTITNSDGEVLLNEPVRFHRRRLTRHTWEGAFAYRLDFTPPPGAKVRLSHHDERHGMRKSRQK